MSEPARDEQVVGILDYLRQMLGEVDRGIAKQQAHRNEIAVRITGLEAASDPAVLAADAEYGTHNYDTARPAQEVIEEAHRRYGP